MVLNNEVVVNYLDGSLQEHFERKDYSIIGPLINLDSLGEPYTTYVHHINDFNYQENEVDATQLKRFLHEAIKGVEEIIGILISTKQLDKSVKDPENALVEIEWRYYPHATIDNESSVLKITLRCSAQHPIEEEK